MESLDRLQQRLDGLDELRDIVKTMKALSAASVRQYERAAAALFDYNQTVERGLQAVIKDAERPLAAERRERGAGTFAAIVFGSDHGLCGRFNEVVAEHALRQLAAATEDKGRRIVLAVGARIAATLEHEGQAVEQTLFVPGSAAQITDGVQQILLTIDAWREQGRADSVHVVHNRAARGQHYRASGSKLLPVGLGRFSRLERKSWPSRSLPTMSMDRDRLLSRLIHQYLFVSIFRACAESQASEHASRLAAMQSAERSLDNKIEDVTAVYRRARQDAITSELLELVAGFETIVEHD